MAPNHQTALGVVPTHLHWESHGVNQRRGLQRRDQLSRRPRYIALRSSPAAQILPIAAIAFGLLASAAWTAFLGYELFRVIGLMI